MARKATWQRHADPRSAPTWRGILFIYYIHIYKWVFVLPYMGRVIPIETVGYYIPDSFIYFSRVGLNFITYLPCRRRGATTGVGSRGWVIDERRSRELRTTRSHHNHVRYKQVITVGLYATWQHLMVRSRGARTTGDRSKTRA